MMGQEEGLSSTPNPARIRNGETNNFTPDAAPGARFLDPTDDEPATIFFAIAQSDRQAPRLTWSSELPIVQMLSDLLKASSASAHANAPGPSDSDGILSASASSPIQAVIVGVRALKMAIACSRYPATSIRYMTIAIVTAPKKGSSPENAVRSMLRSAAPPWQIVLAGDAPRHLHPVPGLQLRKMSPPSGQRFEMQELVLQHLERPEIPPEGALPTPTPLIPSTGVTHTSLPQYPSGSVRVQTGSSQIVKPITGSRLSVSHPSSDAIIPYPHPEEPRSSGGSNKIIIGALAAALLVGAGLVARSFLSRPGPAPAGAAPAHILSPAATPTEAPIPAASQPTPSPLVAHPVRESTVAASPSTTPAPIRTPAPPAPRPEPVAKAAKVVPEKVPAETPHDAPHDTSTHGSFSADQLREILDKADNFAANGNYDQAIKFYNVVLASDPGNGRARSGKERANTNKNMQNN
jgi:hypothetical protein